MKAATIDNLGIKHHERYAQDELVLDKSFIADSRQLSSQMQIAAASTVHSSKWEELFETSVKNLPWATFAPPFEYHRQSNRFFSYCILPTINVSALEGEQLIEKAQNARKGRTQDPILFERDKAKIVNLLSTVGDLNKILGLINARKFNQKG